MKDLPAILCLAKSEMETLEDKDKCLLIPLQILKRKNAMSAKTLNCFQKDICKEVISRVMQRF